MNLEDFHAFTKQSVQWFYDRCYELTSMSCIVTPYNSFLEIERALQHDVDLYIKTMGYANEIRAEARITPFGIDTYSYRFWLFLHRKNDGHCYQIAMDIDAKIVENVIAKPKKSFTGGQKILADDLYFNNFGGYNDNSLQVETIKVEAKPRKLNWTWSLSSSESYSIEAPKEIDYLEIAKQVCGYGTSN